MATQVQFRGGTTTEHASFNGVAREITVDTSKQTVVVHDGSTNGGFPLLREKNPDNQKVSFGNGDDLEIYHSGSDTYIDDKGTGRIHIRGDDGVHIQSYTGTANLASFERNGAVTLYYDNQAKFQTNGEGVVVDGILEMLDNKRIQLGTSDDLQIYHDGSDSYVLNTTDTDLIIQNNGNAGIEINSNNSYPVKLKTNAETAIVCNANGSVDLYHDNSERLVTTAGGVTITGYDANDGTIIKGDLRLSKQGETATKIKWDGSDGTDGQLEIFDDVRLTFGADSDLQMYHTGSDSYIDDTGTGRIHIRGNDGIHIQSYTGTEELATFLRNGAVELYYDNVKKFETTADGVSIQDAVNLSGGIIGSRLTLDSTNETNWTGTRELVALDLIGNTADHRTGTLSIKVKRAAADTVPTEMLQLSGVTDKVKITSAASISGGLAIGTTTSNTSDSLTIVDPGDAYMSIRSDAEADGNNQVLDFAVGTGDRTSNNLVSSITSSIPSGSAAGGTLKGNLSFHTNAGDSISEKLRLTPEKSIFYGTLSITALPTSNPNEAGALWNDSGTVKVSAG